jgi:hypothetical protein
MMRSSWRSRCAWTRWRADSRSISFHGGTSWGARLDRKQIRDAVRLCREGRSQANVQSGREAGGQPGRDRQARRAAHTALRVHCCRARRRCPAAGCSRSCLPRRPSPSGASADEGVLSRRIRAWPGPPFDPWVRHDPSAPPGSAGRPRPGARSRPGVPGGRTLARCGSDWSGRPGLLPRHRPARVVFAAACGLTVIMSLVIAVMPGLVALAGSTMALPDARSPGRIRPATMD